MLGILGIIKWNNSVVEASIGNWCDAIAHFCSDDVDYSNLPVII